MARRAPRTGTPRTSVLGVRVPPEQREAIEAAAAAAGMTASAFVAATMARAVDQRHPAETLMNNDASVSVTAIDAVASGARPANDPSRAVASAFHRASHHRPGAHDDIVEEMRRLMSAESKDQRGRPAGMAVNSHAQADYAVISAVNSPSMQDAERETAVNSAFSQDTAERVTAHASSAYAPIDKGAVNRQIPVAISATIPVYGQVPGFTFIGTGTGPKVASVSRWQLPTIAKTGLQRFTTKPPATVVPPPPRPPVPPPPTARVPRVRLNLDREIPTDDAGRVNGPAVNWTDPAVIYELKRIGNNINQIAHAANSGLTPDRLLMVNAFRHLFEALDDAPEFHKRLAAIRTRANFNDTAHPQSRRRFP